MLGFLAGLFALLAFADGYFTYLRLQKYGTLVEINFVLRFLIERFGLLRGLIVGKGTVNGFILAASVWLGFSHWLAFMCGAYMMLVAMQVLTRDI